MRNPTQVAKATRKKTSDFLDAHSHCLGHQNDLLVFSQSSGCVNLRSYRLSTGSGKLSGIVK